MERRLPNDLSFESKPKWIRKNCEICDIVFWTPPSRNTAKRNKRFCSVGCAGVNHSNILLAEGRGKNARGYKNGKYIHRGYKYILRRNVHGKKQDRYKLEHKIKIEKILGRKLKDGEVVHHIDCDRSNNENSNLLVCERGYHSWLHWKMSEMYGQLVLKRRN